MNDGVKAYEEKLIREFKEGNRERFDELVSSYGPKLYRFAYGLLGNHHDAEEVVQDAFVRAYHALDSFRGDASFDTWMHRITMNLARNKFHWNRRRGEGMKISLSDPESNPLDDSGNYDLDLPDETHSPDTLLEKVELEDNVVKGIRRLPDSLREAMILRHLKDMPYEQIASVLECKIGTVKSRIARGRELLREFLIHVDSDSAPAGKGRSASA